MTTTDTLPTQDPVRTTAPGVGRRVTALVAAGALAVGLLGGVGIGRVTAPAAASAGLGASGFPQGGPGTTGGGGGAGFPGQMGAPGGTSQGGSGQQGQLGQGQQGQLDQQSTAPGTTDGTADGTTSGT